MTDLQELKERLDLLGEVEKDLGPGKKSGRWVQFSCPFPGHAHGDKNPSLGITPENGRFFCFTCGAKGDVITWLHDYRRLSWREIHDLGDSGNLPPARPRPPIPAPDPAPICPPPAAWQARGLGFVAECEGHLWGPEGARALAYLMAVRGLTAETIKAFRLGYNLADAWQDRRSWGLAASNKGLWLPRAIVIPWLIDGALWAVNMRRPAGNPKYYKIAGSQSALFNADGLRGADLLLLTEGEFDCMIAAQEMGDVCGVATLGSASKKLDLTTWGVALLGPTAILAAYDPDAAGGKGAAALAALTERVHPVRVPRLRAGDKDLNDYHRAGGDLWEWLRYHLDRLGLLAALGAPDDAHDLGAILAQAMAPLGAVVSMHELGEALPQRLGLPQAAALVLADA